MQSANDGCIIIAEGMAGSEENFAALMTERAREIGLDAIGVQELDRPAGRGPGRHRCANWPCSRMHIWREYPEYYKYYSQRDFTWNKITQKNRNPLLAMDIGADGMKTGFTEESGYAIVGSVNRDGKRRVRRHERHGERARTRRGSAQAARLGHEGIREDDAVRRRRGGRRGEEQISVVACLDEYVLLRSLAINTPFDSLILRRNI